MLALIVAINNAAFLTPNQAKEFVENAPNVVKTGITKEEAEEIVEKLKAVGAVCEIE